MHRVRRRCEEETPAGCVRRREEPVRRPDRERAVPRAVQAAHRRLEPAALPDLQRLAGNRAVTRMLGAPPTRPKAKGEPVGDEEIKTKGEPAAGPVAASGTVQTVLVSGTPVGFEAEQAEPERAEREWAGLAKTKCPAPATARVSFPTARATSAQRSGMSACTWGITIPDKLKVRTRTCKDGTKWRLRVRSVLSRVRHYSRLLSGQKEATVGRSKRGNFCDQVTELDALGTCSGAWYMKRAVVAHEKVHINEWKTSFPTDWPALKSTIEGIEVPASGATKRRGAATKAMRGSATFTGALATGTGNFPTFWAIPDPNANTDAAEHAVVDPRIERICKHAKRRKWNPGACGVCSAKGIT